MNTNIVLCPSSVGSLSPTTSMSLLNLLAVQITLGSESHISLLMHHSYGLPNSH